MTRPDEIDTILAGWFLETAPSTVPTEIHASVIARARSSRQHVRWSATLREAVSRPTGRPAIRLASLGVVVAAILATTLAISGLPAAMPPIAHQSEAPSPSSAPSDGPQGSPMTSRFVPPFTYTIPDGSGLTGIGGMPGAVAWVVGPNRLPAGSTGTGAFGGQGPETGNLRGVVIADVSGAWGHGPDGRVRLRSDPAGFLADMDTLLTGVDLEPVTAATLDGRPALTARTVPGTGAGHDLHVDGKMTGLSGRYVFMRGPYRLLVADVDGKTVCVQIWARTEEDLATWLPVAQEFVDSLHFVGP